MLSLRSLAAFRIALALVIILDLFCRALDLHAHYSDEGVLPLNVLFERHFNVWYFSFHTMHKQAWFQGILFLVNAGVAGMLLLGYRSRCASILCWVFLVSLQNRNPIVLQGGDVLLRMLVFWSMFLHLDRYWAMDADKYVHEPTSGWPKWLQLPAHLALMLQIAFVYSLAGIIKFYEPSWQQGVGLYYALTTDQFSTSFAKWILSLNLDLSPLNHFVVYAEMFAPLLIFIPFKTQFFHLFAVLFFWGLHAGMASTLHVGLFSLIGVIAWIAILPDLFWKLIGIQFNEPEAAAPASRSAPALSKRSWPAIASAVCVVLALINITWYNLSTVKNFGIGFPSALQGITRSLRIDQRWNMFSRPFFEDGWLVMPALLGSGDVIDLHAPNLKLSDSIPESIAATYQRQRWRKYLMNITGRNYKKDRMEYAKYLCRQFNQNTPASEQVRTFQIIYMKVSNRPGELDRPPKPILLWQHECLKGMIKAKGDVLYQKVQDLAPQAAVQPKQLD